MVEKYKNLNNPIPFERRAEVIEIENLNYIIKNNKYNTCLCVECKTQEELNNLLKQLNLDVKINFTKPLHLKIILKGDGTIDIAI